MQSFRINTETRIKDLMKEYEELSRMFLNKGEHGTLVYDSKSERELDSLTFRSDADAEAKKKQYMKEMYEKKKIMDRCHEINREIRNLKKELKV